MHSFGITAATGAAATAFKVFTSHKQPTNDSISLTFSEVGDKKQH